MPRTQLPPNSPLAQYQEALKEQARAVDSVKASFGHTLFIEPGKYDQIVELQQGNGDGGRDTIRLNPTEVEWVADQFARLLGKVLTDRVRS